MAILHVGPAAPYRRIGDAIGAAQDGDVIAVQAGTYVDDFATITHRIMLQSVGGPARLVATVQIDNGKGILVTTTDVTIDGFEFSGAKVADQNGAGIRYESGDLVIRNSYFHDNENGLLAAGDPNGSILIQNSEFAFNGFGDGQTHGIYIGGPVGEVTIEGSYLHDTQIGHEIKSRALKTTIRNNHIQSNTSVSSYQVDLPQGGVGLIESNVIQQSINDQNTYIFAFGEEDDVYALSSLLIRDNTIVNDAPLPFGVLNPTAFTVVLDGNRVFGFGGLPVHTGSVQETGTMLLDLRPDLFPVPEPAGFATLAVAAAAFVLLRRRHGAALASSAACRI